MSRRTHSRIAVVTTLLLVGVVACITDTTYGQSNLSVQDRDQQATRGLEEPVTVDFFEVALADALEHWSDDTGLQFQVHFRAEDEGVDPTTLVDVRMKDVRLAGVLKDMLEPHNCTWLVRDGVIYVVSEDYAVEHPVTRVIDCTTILATIQPREHLVDRYVILHLQSGNVEAVPAGRGFRGGGIFSVPSAVFTQDDAPSTSRGDGSTTQEPLSAFAMEKVAVTETPEEQLIEAVMNLVEPDSWEENGGTGRIKLLNGKLVVVSTNEIIRQVEQLLEQLGD